MRRADSERLPGARASAGVGIARACALAPVLTLAFAVMPAPAQAQSRAAQDSLSGGGRAAEGPSQASCFFRQEWKGTWKTAPDSRAIYIKVARRIYRLDLDSAYPLLKSPWAVLYNRDSSDTICSAIDFKLVLSDRLGVREAVIVRRLTRLTPAEAASLPKNLRP